MRLRNVLVSGLVVFAVASFGAQSAFGSGTDTPQAASRPAPAVIPSLTDEDRAVADAGLAQSAELPVTVAPLNKAKANAVLVEEGPWHEGEVKLGIVRRYQLSTPINLPQREWPTARFFENQSGHKQVKVKYGVTGLKSFTVLFDTKGKKVVSVEPLEFTALTSVDVKGIDVSVKEAGE